MEDLNLTFNIDLVRKIKEKALTISEVYEPNKASDPIEIQIDDKVFPITNCFLDIEKNNSFSFSFISENIDISDSIR